MANFSTLFPNLQDNLDFTVGDATGTANQIYGWAQANDSTIIPASKLPNLMAGQVYTGTATAAATSGAALTAWVTAFNAATATAAGTNDGITVAAGSQISPGDTLIITDSAGDTETYVFVGTQTTAPADIAGTNAANFRDISHTGDVVDLITPNADGNILVTGTGAGGGFLGQVGLQLDSTLTGISTISNAAGQALGLGISTAITNVNGLNVVVAGQTEIDLTAPTVDINASTAATIDSASIALTSTGTGVSAIDINSGGGIDIDSAGDISIETTNGGFEVNAAGVAGTVSIGGSQATTITGGANLSLTAIASELRVAGTGITAGTDEAPAVLGVGADGRLQTVNVVTGGGALGYATVPDTAATTLTTAQLNGVIFIGSQSQAATITIPATTANGTYIKVINNSGRADTTLSSSNSFVGTADTTLVLNDTSANFELIFTAAGWAVLSS